MQKRAPEIEIISYRKERRERERLLEGNHLLLELSKKHSSSGL